MEYDSWDEFCKYQLPGASLCKIDIWEIVQQNRYLGSSAVEQCFTVHCSVVLYIIYLEIIYWFPSTQPIEGRAPQKLLMQCDELGWIREVYFGKTFCYCNKANYQNNYKNGLDFCLTIQGNLLPGNLYCIGSFLHPYSPSDCNK